MPPTGEALDLGSVVVDGAVDPAAQIRIPLAMINRHGLVAGATGTGKTKTLQVIAEQLSRGRAGADGRRQGRLVRACPGRVRPTTHRRSAPKTPATTTGTPTAFPVEFLSLGTGGIGVPVRATISALRADPAVKSVGAQRHSGVHAGADLPLGRPAGAAAAGPEGPALGDQLPDQRRGQGTARKTSAGCHRRPRASSCGHWSTSMPRAATPSSASPRSTRRPAAPRRRRAAV